MNLFLTIIMPFPRLGTIYAVASARAITVPLQRACTYAREIAVVIFNGAVDDRFQ
jgi:hypothetical protein